MCYKLVQVYHCGCTKEICTTPCPHALETASSPSTNVSSPLPPPYPVSPTESGSNTPQSTQTTSPTDRDSLPSQVLSRAASVRSLPAPTTTKTTSAASLCSISPAPPAPPPKPTLNNEDPLPSMCAYSFKRNTPASLRPCLACYLKPEYATQRERWIGDYGATHFGTKTEDLERLAGIEGIRERVWGL